MTAPTAPLPLHYLMREPRQRDGELPPLLVLLHGVGSNEADLFGLAPELDPRLLVVSLRAPLTLGYGSYAWFHVEFAPDQLIVNTQELEQSRRLLVELIPRLVERFRADRRRVYLLGFSQGTIMSLAVALTDPTLVAGVVAMSGRLAPEAVDRRAPDAELQELPILLLHGTHDDVLPIRYGREARDLLATLPVALTYREFPMAHTVSVESFAVVQGWLRERLDQDPVRRE